jgi:hypothetical protein
MTELLTFLNKLAENMALFMYTINVALIMGLLVLVLSVVLLVLLFKYVWHWQQLDVWLNDRVNRILFYFLGFLAAVVSVVALYELTPLVASHADNMKVFIWASWMVWLVVSVFYWPIFLLLLVVVIAAAFMLRKPAEY